MSVTSMAENFIQRGSLLLLLCAFVLVYYLVKSFTPYGLTANWNEFWVFFLLYEFGATRKAVHELKETLCTYYVYSKIQMDKAYGKITDADIASSIMGDNND